jgi:hypothetical protein
MLKILALVLVVGVAAPVVQVPNVVGLPYEQAKRRLHARGLEGRHRRPRPLPSADRRGLSAEPPGRAQGEHHRARAPNRLEGAEAMTGSASSPSAQLRNSDWTLAVSN